VFISGEHYNDATYFCSYHHKCLEKLTRIVVYDLKDIMPLICVPVAVEFVAVAKPLTTYKHPIRAFYIFGPEDGKLGKGVTEFCEDKVYVPIEGYMNLSAIVNVVLYDRLAKGDSFSHHQDAFKSKL